MKTLSLRVLYFIGVTLLWQFPQTVASWLLIAGLWVTKQKNKGTERFRGKAIIRVKHSCPIGGVSLGEFIILREFLERQSPQVKEHEYGHSIQSLILGPLYLIIIGIPSALLNLFTTISFYLQSLDLESKHGKETWEYVKEREKIRVELLANYYNFYTEKWADKLGGVTRVSI